MGNVCYGYWTDLDSTYDFDCVHDGYKMNSNGRYVRDNVSTWYNVNTNAIFSGGIYDGYNMIPNNT